MNALNSRPAIGAEYDHQVERDRGGRIFFLVLSAVVVLVVPLTVGYAVGEVLTFVGSQFFFGGLGLAFGTFMAAKLFPRYWVLVPQTAAFVTTNPFRSRGDPNVPYGPGGHAAFPWEQRAESGNITLDVLTIGYSETVPTKTTAVKVDGSVQFKFELPFVTRVVGIDIKTVQQGFVDLVKGWLSNRLAEVEGEEARKVVATLTGEIERAFTQELGQRLLEEYGIRILRMPISSIDFSEEVQKVRDATDEAGQIAKGVAILLGFASPEDMQAALRDKRISATDIARARDDFLASSGNVKKEVRRIDITGIEGAGNVGGAIAAGLFGGGK